MAQHDRADLLQGTLDLLILHALSRGPMHGWGISQRIRDLSREVLQIHQGSVYPIPIRRGHAVCDRHERDGARGDLRGGL